MYISLRNGIDYYLRQVNSGQGRQTGRTTAIATLAKLTGATMIVHNTGMKSYVERMGLPRDRVVEFNRRTILPAGTRIVHDHVVAEILLRNAMNLQPVRMIDVSQDLTRHMILIIQKLGQLEQQLCRYSDHIYRYDQVMQALADIERIIMGGRYGGSFEDWRIAREYPGEVLRRMVEF